MPIRMSGLMSGLDTEAIVAELMSVQSMKKTKVQQAKTKLEWKQTAWSDLNSKLVNLYNKYVSKMQMEATYKAKKATVSDTSKANVTAGINAVNGNYTMEVKNVATAQYLTGGKIDASSTNTKLSTIDQDLVNQEIVIKNGDKTEKFIVTESSTIADFTNALKNAGLNANFDTAQKRFFISSKDSGLENAFSITSSAITKDELDKQQAIRDAVGYSNMSTENRKKVDDAITALQTSGESGDAYDKALDTLAKAATDTKTAIANNAAENYVKAKLYSEKYNENYTTAESDSELKAKYYADSGEVTDELKKSYGEKYEALSAEERQKLDDQGKTKEDYIKDQAEADYKAALEKKADELTTTYVNDRVANDETVKQDIKAAALRGKTVDDINGLGDEAKQKYYKSGVAAFAGVTDQTYDTVKSDITSAVNDYAKMDSSARRNAGESALDKLGLANIEVADGTVKVNGAANDGKSAPEGMALVEASDSVILLNGAELTSSSSTVTANGLTIELTGKTDGPISFSVNTDIDGIYNSVKDFLKEYNSVMKEMYTLYNAESAKGYEPLSSEEKESMTDEDVELWEKKIKDSLLRNDSTLDGIMSSMRSAMMSQVSVNGKNYALSSFGIMTSTDWTEGGQLHIYGDPDDSVYGDKDDKLKAALTNDPESVVKALSGIFTNLREAMGQKMSAVPNYSSALTFYQDIKMKSDLKDYEEELDDWDDKLAEMEDRYYDQFTAMEKAMAELQSKQSSLSSLMGG